VDEKRRGCFPGIVGFIEGTVILVIVGRFYVFEIAETGNVFVDLFDENGLEYAKLGLEFDEKVGIEFGEKGVLANHGKNEMRDFANTLVVVIQVIRLYMVEDLRDIFAIILVGQFV
jgi:hypothetical protein